MTPIEIVFVILIGCAAAFSYRRGMLYGGEVTLTALAEAGIIEIVDDGETKTIKTKKD